MEKILFERGSFQFKLTAGEVPDKLMKLINETWLGSKGLRYRHGRVEDRLTNMQNPYHLTLYRGRDILGNITYGRYQSQNVFGKANSYYIRYFAFKNTLKTSTKEKENTQGNSVIKKITGRVLFQHPAEQAVNFGEDVNDPAYHYAFIEPDNMRSLHHAFGFNLKATRKFETLPFFRLKPREIVDCKAVVNDDEKEEVKALLTDFYSDHNGVIFHYLFREDGYFTVRNNKGEIVAGCQANDCLFHITDTGSKLFNGIVKVLKATGLDKKILDVGNLRFLSFDHVYYKPGYEKVLIDLFETLLSKFNLSLSLMFYDSDSPVLKMLKNSGKLGWIYRFYTASPNVVLTHNLNLTDEQEKSLEKHPWFIASYDVT